MNLIGSGSKMKTILVIAAHPDDEILGCGAAMARHASDGDQVHVLIVAEGSTSRRGDDPADAVARLREAACKAASVVGARKPRFLGLPDNRLDSLPLLDIVQSIEAVVNEVRPDIVYTHHKGDLNVDHRCVHLAVMTACRPLPDSPVLAIYAFEVLSSTEWGIERGDAFTPNRFVNIVGQLDTKLAALRCYEAEMREFPHPRSLEAVQALAAFRGATAGMMAAEAFIVSRERIL
jgi:N-acetylglucosamine malate deacetylase 1